MVMNNRKCTPEIEHCRVIRFDERWFIRHPETKQLMEVYAGSNSFKSWTTDPNIAMAFWVEVNARMVMDFILRSQSKGNKGIDACEVVQGKDIPSKQVKCACGQRHLVLVW